MLSFLHQFAYLWTLVSVPGLTVLVVLMRRRYHQNVTVARHLAAHPARRRRRDPHDQVIPPHRKVA